MGLIKTQRRSAPGICPEQRTGQEIPRGVTSSGRTIRGGRKQQRQVSTDPAPVPARANDPQRKLGTGR